MINELPLAAPDREPTKEKLEAAALSLAIFWPTRTPRQCTVALLNSEEGPKVREAAREMLKAAALLDSEEGPKVRAAAREMLIAAERID